MTARTDHERAEFEKWLGIKPCGAAHDFGWAAWQARAALAATPAAAPVIPSELIEAVDAWFAQNTGLGGCSDKDVAELAAIFAAAAPVTLPEPVPTPCRSMFATQREYADAMAQHRKNWAEIEAERALLATGGQAQAVASIYVTEDGQRECDDWKVPLPVGRNLLYAAPQAQADARCVSCNYQHGHAIGCENNPVDIALKNNAAAIAAAKEGSQ